MNKKLLTKLGIGAATAMLLMGCTETSDSSDTVMEIGDYTLSQQEFYEELRDMPYSGAFSFGEIMLEQKIIKQVFEDKYGELVTNKMVEDGLQEVIKNYPSEEQFKESLKMESATVEDVKDDVRMSLLTLEGFKEYKPIEEEELKEVYEDMLPAGMTVRHIFVEDEEVIKEVKNKLDEGEDFVELVEKYSEDEGSSHSGGQYELVRGIFVDEFEEASLELELDEISDIVESEYGYHVIQLIDEGKELTYEEALPRIYMDKYEEMKFVDPGVFEEVIAEVLKEYRDTIVIHEESIKGLVDRIVGSVAVPEEELVEEELIGEEETPEEDMIVENEEEAITEEDLEEDLED